MSVTIETEQDEIKPCSKCGSPYLEVEKDLIGVASHGRRSTIINKSYIRCLDCGHTRKAVTNNNSSSYKYVQNIWNNEKRK